MSNFWGAYQFTRTHKCIYTYILLSKRLCACVEENLPTLDVLEWGDFSLEKLGVLFPY